MIDYFIQLAFQRTIRELRTLVTLIFTLAFGIAICTTTFCLYLALNSEPVPNVSNSLYVVTMDARTEASASDVPYEKPDSYVGLRVAKDIVQSDKVGHRLGLAQSSMVIAADGSGQSVQAPGLITLGTDLSVLGVRVIQGRTWTRDEEESQTPVVLLDAATAKKLFPERDPIGQTVRVGDGLFRVIGIFSHWAPRTEFVDIPRNATNVAGQEESFFIPAATGLAHGVAPFTSGECHKGQAVVTFQSVALDGCRWMEVWVKLDSVSQVDTFRSYLASYAAQQKASGYFVHAPKPEIFSTREWMAENSVIPAYVPASAFLAFGFLCLCVVNATGMLLARFTRRASDFGVRRALGASQSQIFLQAIFETGLIGMLGGFLSLPLVQLGVMVIRAQKVDFSELATIPLEWFLGIVISDLVIGVTVGVIPALRICHLPPAKVIKSGSY